MTARRLCDLHTHSTASDGLCKPGDVVTLADAAGLAALALTDHDTLDGVKAAAEAAAGYPELHFIPGVEFSAECSRGEMHILGLYVEPDGASVNAMADHMASGRTARNVEMLERLRRAGIEAAAADLAAGATGDESLRSVGRAHFARLLVARGRARSEQDAFDRYLAKGREFYVPRVRASAGEIIAAIKNSGGLALLAHPVHLDYGNYAQFERILRDLIDKGLDGLEAYHSHHNEMQSRFFLDTARRRQLVVSGGSDFHGRRHERIGGVKTPALFVEALRRRVG